MIFRISNDVDFRFRADKNLIPQNLISTITARKMLRRGCQGYLTIVKDIKVDKEAVENVLVVYEFLDVFHQ